MAVPLEIAVDHLIQKRRHDLEVIRHSALRLGAELQERASIGDNDQVSVLTRQHDVSLALPRFCQTAETQLRALVRTPADGHPFPEAGQGVALQIALDLSLPELAVKGDAEVRLARGIPTNLALADRHSALVPLAHNALIVRQGNLLDALESLFDAVWSRATPHAIEGQETIDASEIDDQDRELLSLLVAGLTDDAAGARLNMSRRTVARRVQRLMMVTGAHSRLQLGWWARERNWLS